MTTNIGMGLAVILGPPVLIGLALAAWQIWDRQQMKRRIEAYGQDK